METFIPALSPLLVYSPCQGCGDGSVGWKENGEDGSVSGSMGRLSIGFNFTGTGVAFSFTQPIPQNWIHRLLVNGSAPPPTSSYTTTKLTDLPLGAHRFTLDLFPPASDPFSPTIPSNDSVSFTGATGYLGTMLTAATKNSTIDDTAWRSNQVSLSPGWNMLEGAPGGESNWISGTPVDEEIGRLGQSWNSSVSWTEDRGANTTILFGGEAVWVYGATGPEGGRYEVLLDEQRAGVYNASGTTRAYGQILFHTTSLSKGNHSLTLRNMDEGKRLYFDRLVAMSGMGAAALRPSTTGTASLFPTSSSTSSESTTKKLSDGALAGIALGAILAVLALIAGILFFLWRRDQKKRQRPKSDEYSTEKYDAKNGTFFNWPRSSTPPFARMDTVPPPIVNPFSRAWLGTWSNSPTTPTKGRSFIPGMPSTPIGKGTSPNLPQPPSEDRYTSFLKFSKSPGKGRKPPPAISSPVPFDRPEFGAVNEVSEGGSADRGGRSGAFSPALTAAISGKVISPLAQLRGGDLGAESYLPHVTPERKGWKRPSVDTIGKIFGTYAAPRDAMSTPDRVAGGGEGIDMGRPNGRLGAGAHAF